MLRYENQLLGKEKVSKVNSRDFFCLLMYLITSQLVTDFDLKLLHALSNGYEKSIEDKVKKLWYSMKSESSNWDQGRISTFFITEK